jgi:hypothetical protein
MVAVPKGSAAALHAAQQTGYQPVRRDSFDYCKGSSSSRFLRTNPRSAEPDEVSANALSRVLWEIEVTFAVWLLAAFTVEVLFAAAR